MAGGKGTRLRPYTHILPKPLLPIGLRSIIDINIRQLADCGVKKIIIAVGYLGELIQNAIGDGSKYGLEISYSYEERPLGTVGGLSLIEERLEEDFFVLNGDILHNLNFKHLFSLHKRRESDITITTYKQNHNIRLGVLELDEDQNIINYIEKPSKKFIVSIGVYAINKNSIKKYIKKTNYLDFPNLVNQMVENKNKIVSYMHEGLWKDLGTTEDYINITDKLEDIKIEYPEIPIFT